MSPRAAQDVFVAKTPGNFLWRALNEAFSCTKLLKVLRTIFVRNFKPVDSELAANMPDVSAPPSRAHDLHPGVPLRGGDVRERRLTKFRQNVARFRLYRHRFLQQNMRFAAFFKIYQILKLKFLKFDKILQILRHFITLAKIC